VTVTLGLGETLVLCTDGVIEARREGDLFGEARLVETVGRHRGAPVARIAAAVRDAAQAHAGTLEDDLQVLVVRRAAAEAAGEESAGRESASKDTASVQRTVR
jgi:serine phosphatase RsbU (regulator of sigma subunit)